jgi:uncharacterized integral membrane protein
VKLVFWLIALPLFVFVIVFSASNTASTDLRLWPFADIVVPLYAVVLVSALAGFVLGAIITWLQGGHVRSRVRQLMRELEAERREATALREKVARHEAAEQAATIPSAPATV